VTWCAIWLKGWWFFYFWQGTVWEGFILNIDKRSNWRFIFEEKRVHNVEIYWDVSCWWSSESRFHDQMLTYLTFWLWLGSRYCWGSEVYICLSLNRNGRLGFGGLLRLLLSFIITCLRSNAWRTQFHSFIQVQYNLLCIAEISHGIFSMFPNIFYYILSHKQVQVA
jgi:hypothetical protein